MGLIRTIRTLAWVALIAAVYQELKKPPAERTWHGKVGGLIPYDFRIPTVERVRSAYWDPTSNTVFTDRVVGVGWAVNIPALIRKLNEASRQYADVTTSMRERIGQRTMQASGHRPGDGQANGGGAGRA
ncbi:MAG: hypothetical protein HYY42_06200 [Chloroflexi bacterium]|nr:hypothetical protein [Chloroflexota bacterium]MBI2983750.1 hypothetical protein [Chloroflexota bacterium]